MRTLGIALAILLLSVGVASAGPNDLYMVIKGEKDPVLSVVSKAIDAEFPDGVRTNENGNIGYKVEFRSFFSGKSGVRVYLIPMADGAATEATAYRLQFGFMAQRGDGLRHVNALKEQITKIANQQGNVSVETNHDAYRTLWVQSEECAKKLKNDPDLTLIANKVGLSSSDQTSLSMMTDESKPTAAEKKVISQWAEKREKCFSMAKTWMTFFPPDPRALLVLENYESGNQLLLKLYKGNITYAEYNKERKALTLAARQRHNNVSVQLNKEQANAQANASERERLYQLERERIAVEQQKANAMQLEATKIRVPPLPISNSTNCTTRAVGNTLQTNCN